MFTMDYEFYLLVFSHSRFSDVVAEKSFCPLGMPIIFRRFWPVEKKARTAGKNVH
jgi:hypothetical protein